MITLVPRAVSGVRPPCLVPRRAPAAPGVANRIASSIRRHAGLGDDVVVRVFEWTSNDARTAPHATSIELGLHGSGSLTFSGRAEDIDEQELARVVQASFVACAAERIHEGRQGNVQDL